MKKSRNEFLIAAMAFSLLMTGCSKTEDPPEPVAETAALPVATEQLPTEAAPAEPVQPADAYSVTVENLFTERDRSGAFAAEVTDVQLSGGEAVISGKGAEAGDGVLTITEEGTYRLSGRFDGQVIVRSEGKVQLVLDQAELQATKGAAIYVESAKKVFLTLAEGTENSITDIDARNEAEADLRAAVYSKDSLTVNGTGSLTVNGCYDAGISSRDELVLCSAHVTVNSKGTGLQGKDYVAVENAVLNVTAEGDGIKASNETDADKGFVCIASGELDIRAAQDGIQAETELIVLDGTVQVVSRTGSAGAAPHQGDFPGGFGRFEKPADSGDLPTPPDGELPEDLPNIPFSPEGDMPVPPDGDSPAVQPDAIPVEGEAAEGEEASVKGLKAGTLLYIGGGTLTVDAEDDALHSNGALSFAGGSATVSAGDKGVHADGRASVTDGSLTVDTSYEGIEAADIFIGGGTVRVNATDDGFNASDGSAEGGRGTAVDCTLEIAGGEVYVNADGDGLDSNGTITMTGGTVIVDGPTMAANGALDANSTITCSGGTLIAAGASGMAEYPEGPQQTLVITSQKHQGGETLSVRDADGKEVLSFTPAKSWESCVISCGELRSGAAYTVTIDGTEEGTVMLEDTVSFLGEASGMMPGGFPGGGRPDGFDPGDLPEDFDPGNLPEGFDPDNMPEGFNPGQHPGGGRPEGGRPDGERPERPEGGRPDGGQKPVQNG